MSASFLLRLFRPRMWFAESIIKREVERQLRNVAEDVSQQALYAELCEKALTSVESNHYETPHNAAFLAVHSHQKAELWKRIEKRTEVAKDQTSWWPEYRTYLFARYSNWQFPIEETTYDDFVRKLFDSVKLDTYDRWLEKQDIEQLRKARADEKRSQRETNASQILSDAFARQTERDIHFYTPVNGAVSRLAEAEISEWEIEVVIVEDHRHEEQMEYQTCQTYQCWGACDICQNPENHSYLTTVLIPGTYDFRMISPNVRTYDEGSSRQ